MTRSFILPAGAPMLTTKVLYDIELDWDYAYLTVNGASVLNRSSMLTSLNTVLIMGTIMARCGARVQSYGSTFSRENRDVVCLHMNSVEGCYGGLKANPKSDDTKSYWFPPDASIGNSGWFSVPLPGTGTTIEVKIVSA
jgi:hypothetical protein